MNYEEYKTYIQDKKGKKFSDSQMRNWYSQRAEYGEDDTVLADPSAVNEWAKSVDFQSLTKLRGIVGKMDDARFNGDDQYYNELRRKVVRPLKKAAMWDGGVRVAAGEIPPPRYATQYTTVGGAGGRWERRTRRGCAKGLLGLPCDHAVGSNECNGGAPTVRRVGELY